MHGRKITGDGKKRKTEFGGCQKTYSGNPLYQIGKGNDDGNR